MDQRGVSLCPPLLSSPNMKEGRKENVFGRFLSVSQTQTSATCRLGCLSHFFFPFPNPSERLRSFWLEEITHITGATSIFPSSPQVRDQMTDTFKFTLCLHLLEFNLLVFRWCFLIQVFWTHTAGKHFHSCSCEKELAVECDSLWRTSMSTA